MERYLLDTNICVFIMRGKHNLDKKLLDIGIENCCISEITVAELLYGAECSDRPDEIREMVRAFCDNLEVIGIDNGLEEFAKQKAALRRSGTMIDDFDLLIVSTAIANNLIAVTDNTKHFERLSALTLQNWVVR